MEKVICDCCKKECKFTGYSNIIILQRHKNGELGPAKYQICRKCLAVEPGKVKTINLMDWGVREK